MSKAPQGGKRLLTDAEFRVLECYGEVLRNMKTARGENKVELLAVKSLLEDDMVEQGLDIFIVPKVEDYKLVAVS